jgi:hypothetical protein
MELETWVEPYNGTRHIHLKITEREWVCAYCEFDQFDKMMVANFARDSASIEEFLMGLQVYVRKIEEVV